MQASESNKQQQCLMYLIISSKIHRFVDAVEKITQLL
jgi:hypothetical protein